MRQLAPGVYDDDGTLHLDLPAMLEAAGYADTPQNRDTLERSAQNLAAELGIPIETVEPEPEPEPCDHPAWYMPAVDE